MKKRYLVKNKWIVITIYPSVSYIFFNSPKMCSTFEPVLISNLENVGVCTGITEFMGSNKLYSRSNLGPP